MLWIRGESVSLKRHRIAFGLLFRLSAFHAQRFCA